MPTGWNSKILCLLSNLQNIHLIINLDITAYLLFITGQVDQQQLIMETQIKITLDARSKLSLNTEITKFKLYDLQLHHHWVVVCHLCIFIS